MHNSDKAGVHKAGVHKADVHKTGVHKTSVHKAGVHKAGKQEDTVMNMARASKHGGDGAAAIWL